MTEHSPGPTQAENQSASGHPTGEAAGGAATDEAHESHVPLTSIADDLLDQAQRAPAGRAARTVYGGASHGLRQTVIALTEGSELSEHESPGEATLQVLAGHVRLVGAASEVEAVAGELAAVPRTRHSLYAHTDSIVLLTVRVR